MKIILDKKEVTLSLFDRLRDTFSLMFVSPKLADILNVFFAEHCADIGIFEVICFKSFTIKGIEIYTDRKMKGISMRGKVNK